MGVEFDLRRTLARRVYYGWVVVVACLLASVVVFGTTYAFAVFYDSFVETFESSATLLAVVFGVQTALIYVSGVGVSRLVERYGARRVAALSATLLVAGVAWTAIAQSYLELLVAFGVVAAVGMAGLYNVSYATLPRWFDRRRGTATALASTGLGIGLVVVPPGTNAVIAAHGWRTAMLALAGFIAVLSVVLVLLFADDPGAVDADTTGEFDDDSTSEMAERADVPAIVLSRRFLVVLAGWTMIFAPMYVVLGHVVRHATTAGIGRSAGVLSIAVIGLTTTAGRISIGPISDRLGRPRTFVICGGLLGGATAALAVAPSPPLFLAVVAAFGIGYAGCGGLIGAVTADLFGNRSLNMLFAVLSTSFAFAGLPAPPLASLWYEFTGSYQLAFAAFGILGICGAGLVTLGIRMPSAMVRS